MASLCPLPGLVINQAWHLEQYAPCGVFQVHEAMMPHRQQGIRTFCRVPLFGQRGVTRLVRASGPCMPPRGRGQLARGELK